MFRVALVLLGASTVLAEVPDMSGRWHEQWRVSSVERQQLQRKFPLHMVSYSADHAPDIPFLKPLEKQRFKRLFQQCARDGCFFCDHHEGSCEKGTCGEKNRFCRLKKDRKGNSPCGLECAYYALKKIKL